MSKAVKQRERGKNPIWMSAYLLCALQLNLLTTAFASEGMLHTQGGVKMEKVNYGGWQNCIRLTNGTIELITTTDVGPRIIRFGFINDQNLFKEYADQMGQTGGEEWRIYGGHRLWHAPENKPRTYAPDNSPIQSDWNGTRLLLRQPKEAATGIVKEMEIRMEANANRVTVLHRLRNENAWDVELSVWALSVMAQGGRAICPQEPFISHEEKLLPARPIVLWHYTDMRDPRWIWGTKYIQLRQDPDAKTSQKAGVLNTLGWAAYYLKDQLFLKRFPHVPGAAYPDLGCNNEFFTYSEMLEVESLGPLTKIPPGGEATHTETWYLYKLPGLTEDEKSIDEKVLPLIQ